VVCQPKLNPPHHFKSQKYKNVVHFGTRVCGLKMLLHSTATNT
jgi:hypothetical protein